MTTQIRELSDLLAPGESQPSTEWQLRVIQSDQCLSYVAWNKKTKEALMIDPKSEDYEAYQKIHHQLKDYQWLGIIDTHTHADHISIAAKLSEELNAPLMMHVLAPSKRVQVRISRSVSLPSHAAPLLLLHTPGHTQDSITPIWGPFIFGGDTLLFGDTGRDDLPGGDAEAHYESLQLVKKNTLPEMILLPGHDAKGGRVSSWATQLKINTSLQQNKEDFVSDSEAFQAPAPRLLKESLKENFK